MRGVFAIGAVLRWFGLVYSLVAFLSRAERWNDDSSLVVLPGRDDYRRREDAGDTKLAKHALDVTPVIGFLLFLDSYCNYVPCGSAH